ncbi:MAG: CoA-binding protein [Candidatus Hadarchaeales archaeon]
MTSRRSGELSKRTLENLRYLLDPKSVAVIGASRSPIKWGSIILKHVVEGGFKGEVYPVNPNEETLMGLKAYPKVPEETDLALIVTPAKTVPSLFRECAERGVKSAVIISAGFRETGREGEEMEEELVRTAEEEGLPFVGPNCMGVFSATSSLSALMASVKPLKGNVSFLSQSGNLGTQLLDRGTYYHIGFDVFVSTGNEAFLRCEDLIELLRERESTRVILTYIEGVKNGRKFFEVARKTSPTKPIVALKVGKTQAGSRAAKSHTGSLSGSRQVYSGVFRQAGVVEVESTEELLKVAMALEQPLPKNNQVIILTRGGGWGVAATDACREDLVEVAPPPPHLLEEMNSFMPPYWSKGNPIDTVAELDPSLEFKILKVIEKWEAGGLIVLGGLDAYATRFLDRELRKVYVREVQLPLIKRLIALNRRGKTVFAVALKPLDKSRPVKLLRKHRIPVYFTPEDAGMAYSKLIEYKKMRERLKTGGT